MAAIPVKAPELELPLLQISKPIFGIFIAHPPFFPPLECLWYGLGNIKAFAPLREAQRLAFGEAGKLRGLF
jgi:hypothetical protein